MSYTPPDQNANQPQYAAPQYAAPQYAAPNYSPPNYSAGPLPSAAPGEPFDGAAQADDLSRPLYAASFGQAISRFFKSYARFGGRALRSEFWWAQLFLVILQLIPVPFFVTGIIMLVTASTDDVAGGTGIVFTVLGAIIAVLIYLGVLIPSIAISWRRLHDANFAGPFWFLSLTSIGSIVVLVFTLMPPRPEGRRFDS